MGAVRSSKKGLQADCEFGSQHDIGCFAGRSHEFLSIIGCDQLLGPSPCRKLFQMMLLAFAFASVVFHGFPCFASDDKIKELRQYFAQGLTLPVLQARLAKRDFVPIVAQVPNVSSIEILGNHDPRFDGILFAYFSNLSYAARTKFEFGANGDFLIVIEPSIKSWDDLASLIGAAGNQRLRASIFDTAKRNNPTFNNCEYVPLYTNKNIVGGLVYVDPTMGIRAGDICIYKAVFALFGFFVGANITTGERDMALDLTAIRLLYRMEASERNVNDVTNNMLAAYLRLH